MDNQPLLRRWRVRLRAPQREEEEIVHVFSLTAISAGVSASEKLRRRLATESDYRPRARITVVEVVEAP